MTGTLQTISLKVRVQTMIVLKNSRVDFVYRNTANNLIKQDKSRTTVPNNITNSIDNAINNDSQTSLTLIQMICWITHVTQLGFIADSFSPN